MGLQAGFLDEIWVAGLEPVAGTSTVLTFSYLSYKTIGRKKQEHHKDWAP